MTIVKVKTVLLIDCDHSKFKCCSEGDDFGGKKWIEEKKYSSTVPRVPVLTINAVHLCISLLCRRRKALSDHTKLVMPPHKHGGKSIN